MTFDSNNEKQYNLDKIWDDIIDSQTHLPMKIISESVVSILNYKHSNISYIRIEGRILIYKICDDGVMVLWQLDSSIKQSENDNLSLRLLSSNFADNIRDDLNDAICEECNWEKQDLNIQINVSSEVVMNIPKKVTYFG